MARREVAAWAVLAAMAAWTVVTLGFRAIWADVACGGELCDRMREEAAMGRSMLLIAWAAGMAGGLAALVALWRTRRST